jgi:hypothetical protein
MATQSKKASPRTSPGRAGSPGAEDFVQAAQSAPDRPDIFPALKFGAERLAIGSYQVRVLENPHTIKFPDKTQGKGGDGKYPVVEGWSIPVVVTKVVGYEDSEDDQELAQAIGRGEKPRRAILCRKPTVEDGKEKVHGLTRGMFNQAKRNGNELKGLELIVGTRVYEHENYGKTRGYDVYAIGEEQPDLPDSHDDL